MFACHEFESRTLSLVELNRVTQFHFYCVFFMPISSFPNVCFSVKHFGGFCLYFVYLRFGCLSVKKSSFFGLIDNCLSYKYPSASQSLHILCNTYRKVKARFLMCRTGLLFIHKEAPDRWRQPRTTQHFCDFM